MKQLTQSEFKKGARNYENIASPQQDAEHEQIKFMAVDEFGNLQYSQDGVNFETIQSDGKVKPLTSLTPVTSESELPEGNEGDAYAVLTNGNLPLMYYVYTTEWENRGVFVDNTLVYCNNLLYIYNESFNGYFAKTSYTDTAELTNGANFVNTTQLNALSDRVTVVENDKLNKSTATKILYGTDANGDQARLNYGSGASNIVQRDANSQVDVPETPTADGHATSKKYVDTQVGTKQDALSSTQLNAVNSGIDSTKVGQITTNANDIANLQTAVSGKQDTLTAGDNIDITSNVISAKDVVTTNTDQTITSVKTFKGIPVAKQITLVNNVDSPTGNQMTIHNDNGYNGKIKFGAHGIMITGSGSQVGPDQDNASSLGGANYRWLNAYISNNLSDGTNSITIADIASKNVVMFKPLSLSTTTLTDDQITQLRTYNCILTNDLTLGNTSLKAGAILTIPFEYSNSLRGIAIYNNRIMTYYINLTSKQISDGAKDIVISQVANINTDKVDFSNNATITKDSSDRINLNYSNSAKVKVGSAETIIANRIGADSDNTQDIGRSSVRWKDGYFAGVLSDGTNSVSIADITGIQSDVSDIEDKIPAQASSSNQLADKDFVNSSINAFAAYYITKNAQGDPFATKAELNNATTFYSGGVVRVPTTNDYCIVLADESQQSSTGVDPTTRYTYQGNQWEFQYKINDTPLTAQQLSALNSGITSTLVGQIGTNQTDIGTLQTAVNGKQDTLTAGSNIDITGSTISVKDVATTDTAQNITAEKTFVDTDISLKNSNASGSASWQLEEDIYGQLAISRTYNNTKSRMAQFNGNSFLPEGNNGNLGSSSKKWQNCYLSGNLTDGTDSVAVGDIATENHVSGNYVSYTSAQTLSDAEKAQARANIGAGSAEATQVIVNGVAQSTLSFDSDPQTQINGKQATIDSTHKLSADLTEDGTTNKVFTATEQTKLSGIESGAEVNDVTDVQVNGTSILSSKVANIVTNTAYDATTNKIATMSDIPSPVDISGKMDKANPTGTGSLSLNRQSNTTVGTNSVAVGGYTTASGDYSHAEGYGARATGFASHAEGNGNAEASGNSSHAEGAYTLASGDYSHAENCATTASGQFAHAEGYYTTAQRKSQHTFGEYNVLDTTGTTTTRGTYIEIVGNGTANNARSNARTLDWNGNEWLAGTQTAVGGYKIGSSNSTIASVSGTNLTLGNSSLATDIAGSGTRPTYNSNSLALYNDLPANITITTTAGSQSVSDGTNTLNFGSNAFNSTTIPTSYVSSVNGSTGAITGIATTSDLSSYAKKGVDLIFSNDAALNVGNYNLISGKKFSDYSELLIVAENRNANNQIASFAIPMDAWINLISSSNQLVISSTNNTYDLLYILSDTSWRLTGTSGLRIRRFYGKE